MSKRVPFVVKWRKQVYQFCVKPDGDESSYILDLREGALEICYPDMTIEALSVVLCQTRFDYDNYKYGEVSLRFVDPIQRRCVQGFMERDEDDPLRPLVTLEWSHDRSCVTLVRTNVGAPFTLARTLTGRLFMPLQAIVDMPLQPDEA